MWRLDTNITRLLPVGLAVGALALGPSVDGAGASNASIPPTAQTGPGAFALADGSTISLSNGRTISRWAHANTAAVVRQSASELAPAVGRLHFLTEDGQAEVYMALRETRVAQTGVVWVDVSLPQRPNGVTGWVPASALGPLHVAGGRLVVSRSLLRATLYNQAGAVIWSARVGIGRPALPTPAGHFYVREKLRAIGSPVYGPYAIATSAYASPKLSEWPGGGIIGIHGTDQPQLIPGDPSHGCVRMLNSAITRLWHMIAIGTPIDIT
ncbi:MAG: L,D-transpeptidase [Solirubrobacteraceae bacterium]